MNRINRDSVVAIVLLLICGIFFWASFDIRQPDYGTLMPSTWPRVIVTVLSFLSVIYLAQSLRGTVPSHDDETGPEQGAPNTFLGWLGHWRNVFWCFALFLAYLASMPLLGMLIGGILFVFLLLCALGGWELRKLALHGVIACISVGGMWSVFTFGLGVILPPGRIFNPF